MKRGFAHARNLGVKNARYDTIAFTDADCTVPPHWLKRMVRCFDDETGGVGGSAYPPPNSSYWGLCIACLGFPAGGAIGLDCFGKDISTCNALFRKGVLDEIKGFNEKLKHGGEDTDLSRRIRERGYKLKHSSSFVYHKARSGAEFLKWNYKRGNAKFYLNHSLFDLFSPLYVLAFPFTRKFRLLIKRRRRIKVSLFSIFITIPFLFFIKQLLISLGWLNGLKEEI